MWASYTIWIIAFVLVCFIVFGTLIYKKRTVVFQDMCPAGKVCTLLPGDIDKVIASGDAIVVFMYSPKCDTSQQIKPVLERFCTEVNGTVFCQINCEESSAGQLRVYHQGNYIGVATNVSGVKHLLKNIRG